MWRDPRPPSRPRCPTTVPPHPRAVPATGQQTTSRATAARGTPLAPLPDGRRTGTAPPPPRGARAGARRQRRRPAALAWGFGAFLLGGAATGAAAGRRRTPTR